MAVRYTVQLKGFGEFVREGELSRWLSRVAADKDGAAWLVARAIAGAIRHRAKPGDGIPLMTICRFCNMPAHVAMGVIARLRERGRLQFTRNADHLFFDIPNADIEAAWQQQREGG
jgi:hypothetical protein